jgi:nitrite reductase (NO-forming)
LLLIGHAAGLPLSAGRLLPGLAFMLAMAVLTAIYLAIWRRQGSFPLLVQILGAVAGLGGAALWTRGAEVALIVPWWACFLVLTILGERLELARVAFATGSTEKRVLAESCILLLLLPATLLVPAWGYPLLGVALTVLVADVGMHDVARRTIRTHGLTRLMAACMIAGYAWALVAAAIWILQGPTFSGYGYDLVVHAITIGFALSMVIAHAPVIIPAIVHRPLPYHPVMWVIAVILHGGLLTRALAGTRDAVAAWQFGGAASLLAVLALMVTVVVTTSRAERSS